MARTPQGRLPWALEDVREILAGTAAPDVARETDRKGLTPAAYASLKAAATADALTPLLDLLEPPGEGEDRVAQVLDLLAALTEAQLRTEAKLDALAAALTGAASSRPSSGTASTPSRPARSLG